jgi:hypothetical protein
MGANDFTIGGMLMQVGWPLHMRSQSLTVVKQDGQVMGNYSLPHCITWRCGNIIWGGKKTMCT